jgi:hypothetical protein
LASLAILKHQFLDLLDSVFKCLHHSSVKFILCGDINVNYLIENKNKNKLSMIMNTYNLEGVVDFPTRIFKDRVSQLDNIFLERTNLHCISVYPKQNGLSDRDAQFLILDRTPISSQTALHKHKIRQINDETLASFQALLKKHGRLYIVLEM